MSDVVRIGGSHAQRELWEDTLIVAYLRAGHGEQGRRLISTRLDRRPSARDHGLVAGGGPGTGSATQKLICKHFYGAAPQIQSAPNISLAMNAASASRSAGGMVRPSLERRHRMSSGKRAHSCAIR